MKIAIIGAKGYVGTALCKAVNALKTHQVLEITRDNYLAHQNEDYDIVINSAMPSGRFWAKNHPQKDFVETVQKTADLVYGWKYKKFIQISTVSARCQLDTVYGRHKLSAEKLCEFGENLIVRLGALYSSNMQKGALADLQKLLSFLEIVPQSVCPLKPINHKPSRILEEAFQMAPQSLERVDNISLAECASPQQEAEVIALALRQVLETPGKTGMLITHDEKLARRVRMALQRWNIQIIGCSILLSQTPLGLLCGLTAQWIHPEFNLGVFLATLKHSLVCDLPIDSLEMEVIRKGAWSWELIVQKSKSTTLEPFVQELQLLIKDCQNMAKASHVSFEKVMRQHQHLVEYLLKAGLWPEGVEYARDMQTFWEGLQKASHGLTISTGADYAKLLVTYLDQVNCKSLYTHDRIRMVDLVDARLLHADVVILGGLNEGCWPQNLPADPWFNRTTRKKVGLPPPEESIGLSAHDFVQAGAASEILLTRSVRVEGTPTVPSSFLVKVQTWLHQQGQKLPVAKELLDWSTLFLETITPISAPAPKPPAEMRPRTLSISDMATWVQNPYGVYAKHILGLRPLPSPFEHNNALIFGTIVHLALQKILLLVQAKALDISDATEQI
jgi:ATP-dependent helicase/nuclease subunit B